jgi:hypothetical protein
MTGDLAKLMANLSDSERGRLEGAFASDPELAQGLGKMLADLPPGKQAQIMRRLAAHVRSAPLGGGALVPALADVIEQAMEQSERDTD